MLHHPHLRHGVGYRGAGGERGHRRQVRRGGQTVAFGRERLTLPQRPQLEVQIRGTPGPRAGQLGQIRGPGQVLEVVGLVHEEVVDPGLFEGDPRVGDRRGLLVLSLDPFLGRLDPLDGVVPFSAEQQSVQFGELFGQPLGPLARVDLHPLEDGLRDDHRVPVSRSGQAHPLLPASLVQPGGNRQHVRIRVPLHELAADLLHQVVGDHHGRLVRDPRSSQLHCGHDHRPGLAGPDHMIQQDGGLVDHPAHRRPLIGVRGAAGRESWKLQGLAQLHVVRCHHRVERLVVEHLQGRGPLGVLGDPPVEVRPQSLDFLPGGRGRGLVLALDPLSVLVPDHDGLIVHRRFQDLSRGAFGSAPLIPDLWAEPTRGRLHLPGFGGSVPADLAGHIEGLQGELLVHLGRHPLHARIDHDIAQVDLFGQHRFQSLDVLVERASLVRFPGHRQLRAHVAGQIGHCGDPSPRLGVGEHLPEHSLLGFLRGHPQQPCHAVHIDLAALIHADGDRVLDGLGLLWSRPVLHHIAQHQCRRHGALLLLVEGLTGPQQTQLGVPGQELQVRLLALEQFRLCGLLGPLLGQVIGNRHLAAVDVRVLGQGGPPLGFKLLDLGPLIGRQRSTEHIVGAVDRPVLLDVLLPALMQPFPGGLGRLSALPGGLDLKNLHRLVPQHQQGPCLLYPTLGHLHR